MFVCSFYAPGRLHPFLSESTHCIPIAYLSAQGGIWLAGLPGAKIN